MQIRVYSNPNCVQCETTKRYLENNEIRFEEVNLQADPISLDMVTALGYNQVPVVYIESKRIGVKHWSGFRYRELSELVNHFQRDLRDTPKTS